MADEAPTRSQVKEALRVLISYGRHGTKPDPPSSTQQAPPAPATGSVGGKGGGEK